jgi:hypothetical protein
MCSGYTSLHVTAVVPTLPCALQPFVFIGYVCIGSVVIEAL